MLCCLCGPTVEVSHALQVYSPVHDADPAEEENFPLVFYKHQGLIFSPIMCDEYSVSVSKLSPEMALLARMNADNINVKHLVRAIVYGNKGSNARTPWKRVKQLFQDCCANVLRWCLHRPDNPTFDNIE